MKLSLLFISSFLSITFLFGQSAKDNNPLKFNAIPPAPEAAALGKFIDMPVSAYTGLPKIEIPLSEVKSYQLSIPVSLSYHASGIKWEEIPSWVGAGWALNAGGVVSRTIRGRNDEDIDFGFFKPTASGQYDLPGFFNSDGSVNTSMSGLNRSHFSYVSPDGNCDATPGVQYNSVLYASKGGLDLEPDLFFYSLPDGQSAKFLFSRQKEMKVIPHQYVNIIYTNDQNGQPFKSWVINGKDGTKYYFEKQESTVSSSTCAEIYDGTPESFTIPNISAVSTWKLTKLVSANGLDSIWFNYVPETLSYEATASISTYDLVSGSLAAPGTSGCSNFITVNGWRLASIQSAAGYKAEFVANTTRADLSGGKFLNEVKFYHNNVFIKRYVLTISTNTGLPILTQMQEVFDQNTLNTRMPPTIFTYYTDGLAGSYSRTSASVDHWGYHNGVTGNQNDVRTPATIHQNIFYNGANREADLTACRWMTLKQVQHPTGGTTNYDYELHDYSNVPTFTDLIYSPGATLLESVELNTAVASTQTKQFVLTQSADIVILYEIPNVPGGIPVSGCNGTLSKTGGGFTAIQFLSGSAQTRSAPIQSFGAGTYTIYGEFDPSQFSWGGIDPSTLHFYIRVYKVSSLQERISNGALKGGGLRIKSITAAGDQTITKTYVYKNSTTGLSSGKLMSFPFYAYLGNFSDGSMQSGICVENNASTILVRANGSTLPLTVVQGSHVAYDEVKEILGTEVSNNGYSIFRYTNTPDESSGAYPFVPNTSYSHKNGFLLSQEDFTTAGKIVKRKLNTYNVIPDLDPIVEGLKVVQSNNSGCKFCPNRQFSFRKYRQNSDKIELATTVITEYDATHDSYFESSAAFQYNTFDEIVLKVEKMSNTGQLKETVFAYHDVLKATPIEQYSYYRTNEFSSQRQYASGFKWTFHPTLYKPTEVYQLEGTPFTSTSAPASNAYKKRLNFTDFDNHGNVVSYKIENEPAPTSLVWGYGKLFPIAQVTAALPTDIAFTSFEGNQNEGNWSFSLNTNPFEGKTGLVSHMLNQTITSPSINSSKRYVVSFWATGGTPVISAGVVRNDDASTPDGDGWKYYEKTISGVSGFTISGSASVSIDELRLYPEGSQMTTFTYDPRLGMRSKTDANNFTTFYEYGNRQQLEYIKDFQKNILKKFEYHYSQD